MATGLSAPRRDRRQWERRGEVHRTLAVLAEPLALDFYSEQATALILTATARSSASWGLPAVAPPLPPPPPPPPNAWCRRAECLVTPWCGLSCRAPMAM